MGAGGSSRGKVIDPSEHPQFTPKYTAPFYMALDIECAEFPQAPVFNSASSA